MSAARGRGSAQGEAALEKRSRDEMGKRSRSQRVLEERKKGHCFTAYEEEGRASKKGLKSQCNAESKGFRAPLEHRKKKSEEKGYNGRTSN